MTDTPTSAAAELTDRELQTLRNLGYDDAADEIERLRAAVAAASPSLGAPQWLPIESAPKSGVLLLAVNDAAGERRTFVAEASDSDGNPQWNITVGWTGWSRLHDAWKPVGWTPLPSPPGETTT